jgi:hypothetical protein
MACPEEEVKDFLIEIHKLAEERVAHPSRSYGKDLKASVK